MSGSRWLGRWRSYTLCVAIALLVVDGFAKEGAADVAPARASVRGIYLQQGSLQKGSRLDYLIHHAKRAGLNTFVVDLTARSRHYARGITKLDRAGIAFVPRIVVFPDGGASEQVRAPQYWERRWKLIDYALSLGAKRVQLDYVRYSSSEEPSPQNSTDIARVVRFFAKRVRERGAHLEIDVFGEVAHRTSRRIGQDIRLLAPEIDAVCPMVYPSHYEPFLEHAAKPFTTVFDSLTALKVRMGEDAVPIHAYIELFNYRVPMNSDERADYIDAQLDAVSKADADGWYAWSASNRYDILFQTLARRAARR